MSRVDNCLACYFNKSQSLPPLSMSDCLFRRSFSPSFSYAFRPLHPGRTKPRCNEYHLLRRGFFGNQVVQSPHFCDQLCQVIDSDVATHETCSDSRDLQIMKDYLNARALILTSTPSLLTNGEEAAHRT